MKPSLTVLTIACLLTMTTSATAQNEYGWTISASFIDPFVNSMAPSGTLTTVYLWFNCSGVEGMAAAEFDIVSTGITHISTTPVNGYINAGSTTHMLLAVGGCPPGPVIACNLATFQPGPGNMCLAPADVNGNKVTVDCQAVPTGFPFDWYGLDIGGGPCGKGDPWLCEYLAVRETSWGELKALYR